MGLAGKSPERARIPGEGSAAAALAAQERLKSRLPTSAPVPPSAPRESGKCYHHFHVDLKTTPPINTQHLWMGTPYAKWIERDVRIQVAQEVDDELERLRRQVQEEQLRRLQLEEELRTARAELSRLCIVEQDHCALKKRVLGYISKSAQVSEVAFAMNLVGGCFASWREHCARMEAERQRTRPRPDLEGCRADLDGLRLASLQQFQAIQDQYEELAIRYMTLDAYVDGKPLKQGMVRRPSKMGSLLQARLPQGDRGIVRNNLSKVGSLHFGTGPLQSPPEEEEGLEVGADMFDRASTASPSTGFGGRSTGTPCIISPEPPEDCS